MNTRKPTRRDVKAPPTNNNKASISKNCKEKSKRQSKRTNKPISLSNFGKTKKTNTKNISGRRSKQ